MAVEIGSEFWDVPTKDTGNELFPEFTQWFLSGRSALYSIIKSIKRQRRIRSAALPSWCCDSMIIPFLNSGIDVHFYNVLGAEQEIGCVDTDILLVIDYFGYTGYSAVPSNCKAIVIRDITHSILSCNYTDADYYFGSLRKWCGVWTGGFAWARDSHRLEEREENIGQYVSLRHTAMQQKKCYINEYADREGRRNTDKTFLRIFDAAEERLENIGIAPAAKRDICLARNLDSDFIIAKRSANSRAVREAFAQRLVFPNIMGSDCPMFVPISVPDGKRDEMRRYLIQNDIYCPVHWPVSQYHKIDKAAKQLYKKELSLVCDQRYTEEDMYRVVETINRFWRDK